jgi:hypothetical protein
VRIPAIALKLVCEAHGSAGIVHRGLCRLSNLALLLVAGIGAAGWTTVTLTRERLAFQCGRFSASPGSVPLRPHDLVRLDLRMGCEL